MLKRNECLAEILCLFEFVYCFIALIYTYIFKFEYQHKKGCAYSLVENDPALKFIIISNLT